MLGKIRFILVVLLFAALGALCRTQAARCAACFDGETFLVQQNTSHGTDASRFCGHTFLAPDIVNEVQSPGSDQKIQLKSAATAHHGLMSKSVFSSIAARNAALSHPLPRDYYVFSLEKIRI